MTRQIVLAWGWFGRVAAVVAGSAALSLFAAPLRVVTTTSMVTDVVKQVGGDAVVVEGLMGPGVDPHLYKARASDVVKLQKADIIFYSGLMLEGKMSELFERISKSKRVVAITGMIPKERLLRPEAFEGHPDPHVWLDVELWAFCIQPVIDGLSAADPTHRADYAKRGDALKARFMALHRWSLEKAAELPSAKRILVTSHDAYNYFGRAYGFQVIGLQGISTVSEAALSDMAKLVDFIKKRSIKAIFVESSVPHATIQRIAEDARVRVGGELFSDAMGTPGQIENGYDLGTYEGMVKHNLNTIVEALK